VSATDVVFSTAAVTIKDNVATLPAESAAIVR